MHGMHSSGSPLLRPLYKSLITSYAEQFEPSAGAFCTLILLRSFRLDAYSRATGAVHRWHVFCLPYYRVSAQKRAPEPARLMGACPRKGAVCRAFQAADFEPLLIETILFNQGEMAMPGRDRTGPRGLGPMTGRRLGFCSGAVEGGAPEGYYGPFLGRGPGRGWGWRRFTAGTTAPVRQWAGRGGFGAADYSQWAPRDELSVLKDHISDLEEALDAARARMAQIERDRKAE